MVLEIKIPPVGESIAEVTLSRWIKSDGDFVEMDEVIAELESDKATFELTAEQSGVLKTITPEAETIPIGTIVCTIDTASAKPAKKSSSVSTVDVEEVVTPTSEKENYAKGHPSPAASKYYLKKISILLK